MSPCDDCALAEKAVPWERRLGGRQGPGHWRPSTSQRRSQKRSLQTCDLENSLRKHFAEEMFMWWFSPQGVSDSCDPMDCSLSGSSVHGILQARILEWVAISFSRGSSQPTNRTWVSFIVGRFLFHGKHWACFPRYKELSLGKQRLNPRAVNKTAFQNPNFLFQRMLGMADLAYSLQGELISGWRIF